MNLIAEIRKLVEEKIDGTSYFIVDIVESGHGGKISVLLDGDEGVNISECAKVSRFVTRTMEEREGIEQDFTLEVSSPGADQPLKLFRQYPKHIGRELKIEKTDGSKIKGTLTEAEDDELTLVWKEKEKGKKAVEIEQKIPMAEIKESRVVISFK